METESGVPSALRKWFVAHFAIDMLAAIPLFAAPQWFLGQFGWTAVDATTARLAAAAMFAIGIQSLLGRNESPDTYSAMLSLKMIWSAFAVAGLAISAMQGAPATAWMFAAVFAGFFLLWTYWKTKLANVDVARLW